VKKTMKRVPDLRFREGGGPFEYHGDNTNNEEERRSKDIKKLANGVQGRREKKRRGGA